MLLTLSKIITTFITIVLLAHIAKHLSPRFAGILGGFPLGSGLALYFFAWQHGDNFASESALASVSALSASLLFVLLYRRLIIRQARIRFIPLHTFIAFSAFLLAASIIEQLPKNFLLRFNFTLTAIIACHYYFKRIPDQHIGEQCDNRLAKRLQNPSSNTLFRAAVATLSILIITSIADAIGSSFAGILAVFPISFFPLMLILHISYGSDVLASSIKYYPVGLGALLTYTSSVYLLYPPTRHALGNTAIITVFLHLPFYLRVLSPLAQSLQHVDSKLFSRYWFIFTRHLAYDRGA